MKNGNKFSRRKFLKNTALGLSLFSLDKNLNALNLKNNIKNKKGDNKKMAYEWIFNKRPYTDEEAKELLKK